MSTTAGTPTSRMPGVDHASPGPGGSGGSRAADRAHRRTGPLTGLGPGVSIAWLVGPPPHWGYGPYPFGPIRWVSVPWLELVVMLLVIPALAAGVAWLSARKEPSLTRRLT